MDGLSPEIIRQKLVHRFDPTVISNKEYADPCPNDHEEYKVRKLPKRVKLKKFNFILSMIGCYICVMIIVN